MKKRIAALALAGITVFAMTGCGGVREISVNEQGEASYDVYNIYLTPEEYTYYQTVSTTELDPVTYDGKEYYLINMLDPAMMTQELLTMDTFAELTGDTAVFAIVNGEEEAADKLGKNYDSNLQWNNTFRAAELTETEEADSSGTEEDFDVYTIHMTQPIVITNGVIGEDGKSVTFDLLKLEGRGYLTTSAEKAAGTSLTLSGVKDGKIYKKAQQVSAKSDGIILSLTDNGTECETNTIDLSVDGKHIIKAQTLTGSQACISCTIDQTAPKVSVKAKTYKKAVKITFSDKTTGVKTATLNGKTIKSGKKVSANGSYKLIVTDKAGNKKAVTFKIKK